MPRAFDTNLHVTSVNHGQDGKLQAVMGFCFWETGIPFSYHYSKTHCDAEWWRL